MVYITVSGGQVIVTVNPLALIYSLTDQEVTLSNRTRPNETFIIITILIHFEFLIKTADTKTKKY
jgi:hypothetical protein